MTTPNLQSPFNRQAHQRLSASCERARSRTAGLSAAQLNWKPAADKWSIAQCLDHMLRASDQYLEKMLPVIQRARAHQRPAASSPRRKGSSLPITSRNHCGAGFQPAPVTYIIPISRLLPRAASPPQPSHTLTPVG